MESRLGYDMIIGGVNKKVGYFLGSTQKIGGNLVRLAEA